MTTAALALLLLWQAPPTPLSWGDFEAALGKIPAYEHGQNREPLAAVSEFIRKSLADSAALGKVEARLAEVLRGQATHAAQDFLCRELSVIGTEVSVPALGGLLLDAATSDMARYALERIPVPAAADALLQALPKAAGKVKVGIIGSLGARGEARSVPALQPLLASPDAGAAGAAIAALAHIADPRALAALAGVKGALLPQALEARLQLADLLVRRGDRTRALAAYRQLYAPANPAPIRAGALRGLAASDNNALPTLRAALLGSEPALQTAAISLLAPMPGANMTALLLEALPRLPPAARAPMLTALADRGDASARPALVSATKSDTPAERIAALEGLARLGDASVVGLLAQTAASATGAEQAAARNALARLPGAPVDAAIVAGLTAGSAEVRIELMRAAASRGLRAAAETLVKTARDSDAQIRRESLRALRETAGGAQVPALLELLNAASSAADRRETERALSSALRAGEPPGVAAVVAACESASQTETRISLFGVLGRTGDPQALPPLRRALGDSSAEIQRAAILALGEWPGAAALPDLIKIASSDPNAAFRVLALRGYIKLAALPSERPPRETVKLLAEGLGAAQRPDEKKLVLAALPGAVCPEALALAESLRSDPAVAAEAKAAADRLRRALGSRR